MVGWATSANVDGYLALAALTAALRDRRPSKGLVHHSDRGSAYASADTETLSLSFWPPTITINQGRSSTAVVHRIGAGGFEAPRSNGCVNLALQ